MIGACAIAVALAIGWLCFGAFFEADAIPTLEASFAIVVLGFVWHIDGQASFVE